MQRWPNQSFRNGFFDQLFFLLYPAGVSNFRQSWLKLRSDERIAYVGGVLDTWDDDVALCEKKPEEPWCAHVKLAYEPIVLCSQHHPYKEIVAVVEKYLKEHSDEGERSITGHIWIALYESCQKPLIVSSPLEQLNCIRIMTRTSLTN
jgi:hypothetical protein